MYRTAFMVLTNSELYLYPTKTAFFHEKLIVMKPGVFVKSLPPIAHFQEIAIGSMYTKNQKLYPINLHVGGTLGNVGVEPVQLQTQTQQGTITLYFLNLNTRQKVQSLLEKSAGCFNIND